MLQGFAEQSFDEKGNTFFKGQKGFVRYFYGSSRNNRKVNTKRKVENASLIKLSSSM